MQEEKSIRRLNLVAYFNIGLGAFSLLAWALPGPWTIHVFWQALERSAVSPGDAFGSAMVSVMKALVVLVVLIFWVLSAVSIANGYLILKRRRHRLCVILSGVSIFGTPLHLILGIISLVALTRDWARSQFGAVAPDGERHAL